MSYLIAASLIYHTWTAWMFNLPGEIFLCAHMPIYHFVTILARFFPLIHTFQARACGKSGLVTVRFFFFQIRLCGGWRHTQWLCGGWRCRSAMCQLLCVTPGSPSMRERLAVPAGSQQTRAPRHRTEQAAHLSGSCTLRHSSQSLILFPPCFAPWVWLLAATLFCFSSLSISGLCQGFAPPSQQSTREARELSWALGGGKKEIKKLPLPFADAFLKMLWLRALCCCYSNLPCAIPGIHASVCGALHCSSLLLSLP